MGKPIISMIAAIGRKNRELGKDNQLLWDIPADMAHFRAVTSGHAVIMGQLTFESIGRPLPNRVNIIATLDAEFHAPGCVVVHSLDEALKQAKEHEQEEVFVIGGGSIYKQMLPFVDKLYLTLVDGEFEADTFFPEYTDDFEVVESLEKGESGGYSYEFLILKRK